MFLVEFVKEVWYNNSVYGEIAGQMLEKIIVLSKQKRRQLYEI